MFEVPKGIGSVKDGVWGVWTGEVQNGKGLAEWNDGWAQG